MRNRSTYGAVLALALLFGLAAPAQADDCANPITTVPCTISVQGVYKFAGPLAVPATFTSGVAITIAAPNVTLDLGGFQLGTAAGPEQTAIGVYALNRKNVVIKNGAIRGYAQGVVVEDGTGGTGASCTPSGACSKAVMLDGLRLDLIRYRAVHLQGVGHVVKNTTIVDVGGSTAVGVDDAIGIQIDGHSCRVVDNDVALLTATDQRVGIQINGSDSLVVQNRLSSMATGVVFSGSGSYRDNLSVAVTTPYTGGTNAGNNQ